MNAIAVACGVHSVLSFRLFVDGQDRALTVCGSAPLAFSETRSSSAKSSAPTGYGDGR
jgi:hypothetical protein